MKTRNLAVAAVATLGLAACQPTGENNNALGGAAIGAVAGSLIGNAIGDDTRGTVVGGLIGAGIGGAIGNQLDQQERELRQTSLGSSGAVITNTGNELIVTLPEGITFDVGSDIVKSRFLGSLGELAANLNQFPNSQIDVIGHTDNTGSQAFNQGLSERRAQTVADILVRNGVNGNRVFFSGQGENRPVASNASAAGRQQNRRVEITITPTG